MTFRYQNIKSMVIPSFMYIYSYNISPYPRIYCNSEPETPSKPSKQDKCRQYNSYIPFLFNESVAKKCANDPDCFYIERSSGYGQCVNKNDTIEKIKSDPESLKDKHIRLYAEIIGPDPISKGLQPIKILVNEKFVESALDSIKDSHMIATSLGKDIVINILDDKDSRSKLGEWLQYIFSYESVRSPTRWLIYWSLTQDDMMFSTSKLLRLQLAYWLAISDMKHYTKAQLLGTVDSWMKSNDQQTQFIIPLIEWTTKQEDVQASISTLIVDSLPYSKEQMEQGLAYLASEVLKSEATKKAAKDAVIQFLVSTRGKDEHPPVNKPSTPKENDDPIEASS